jgi:hypothetical protein
MPVCCAQHMSLHEIYKAQVLAVQLLHEPHKSADAVRWARVHDAVADPERKRDWQLTTTAVRQFTSSSRRKTAERVEKRPIRNNKAKPPMNNKKREPASDLYHKVRALLLHNQSTLPASLMNISLPF